MRGEADFLARNPPCLDRINASAFQRFNAPTQSIWLDWPCFLDILSGRPLQN
jgi:hypothetical protein